MSEESTEVRYPDITVELTGQDGNAFMVMGLVKRGLQKAGVSLAEQNLFMEEAMSGDYDHLLRTAMSWVNVE